MPNASFHSPSGYPMLYPWGDKKKKKDIALAFPCHKLRQSIWRNHTPYISHCSQLKNLTGGIIFCNNLDRLFIWIISRQSQTHLLSIICGSKLPFLSQNYQDYFQYRKDILCYSGSCITLNWPWNMFKVQLEMSCTKKFALHLFRGQWPLRGFPCPVTIRTKTRSVLYHNWPWTCIS